MRQTLTNALLKASVTRLLYVTTPKDLTPAPVKMDLRATGKIARVRFCGVHGHFWPLCKALVKQTRQKDRFSD